ncbi:MAG: photosynthetic protein synthase I [Burkholderiales bacterium RIFCSPLOWO2_12_FULL_61_40]|nr:MAG: photosynthetic protein synthase I [Burkholderiales bacterium RIFCSPLOWO2_12_FULL_61_40]
MHKRTALKLIAACAVSAGAAGLFSACSEQKPAFVSIDLTGATYAKNFELTDHHGQVRHLPDFAGKVVVLFFGYTQCPDVCPTAMVELASIKTALGKDGERLQGLFVSIDPERDTPEVLKAYMGNFDPSFLALTTSPAKLAELAKDFKVYYKKVEGKTPTSYTMDHSAGSYVYDAKGQLRLFTRYGSAPQGLTADIQQLLKEAS